MPVFAYRGLAANGRSVAGVVDADSVRTARGKLRERGIFPTELAEEETAAKRSLSDYFPSFGRRIPPAELSLLTRQLSSLLGAGVQLVDALGALGRPIDPSGGQTPALAGSRARARGYLAGRRARRSS